MVHPFFNSDHRRPAIASSGPSEVVMANMAMANMAMAKVATAKTATTKMAITKMVPEVFKVGKMARWDLRIC